MTLHDDLRATGYLYRGYRITHHPDGWHVTEYKGGEACFAGPTVDACRSHIDEVAVADHHGAVVTEYEYRGHYIVRHWQGWYVTEYRGGQEGEPLFTARTVQECTATIDEVLGWDDAPEAEAAEAAEGGQ